MTPDSKLATEFIQARHYTPGRHVEIGVLVGHSTSDRNFSKTVPSARAEAKTFASAASPLASFHYVVDAFEIIQVVAEADTAWHAPGANANGIGVELCGFAQWSADEWEASGVPQMAAPLFADICTRHHLPIEHRTAADLLAGLKGIPGHVDVNGAFHKGDHWDPGPGFPWDFFIGLCVEARSAAENADTDPPAAA